MLVKAGGGYIDNRVHGAVNVNYENWKRDLTNNTAN